MDECGLTELMSTIDQESRCTQVAGLVGAHKDRNAKQSLTKLQHNVARPCVKTATRIHKFTLEFYSFDAVAFPQHRIDGNTMPASSQWRNSVPRSHWKAVESGVVKFLEDVMWIDEGLKMDQLTDPAPIRCSSAAGVRSYTCRGRVTFRAPEVEDIRAHRS